MEAATERRSGSAAARRQRLLSIIRTGAHTMNAKHLIAALLSTALLVGCNDAGPLAPGHTSSSASNVDTDPPHPPIQIEDPVKPLPPVDWDEDSNTAGGGNSRGGKLDPVFPMPPIDDGGPAEDRPDDQDR
jgi:hypothetical protein